MLGASIFTSSLQLFLPRVLWNQKPQLKTTDNDNNCTPIFPTAGRRTSSQCDPSSREGRKGSLPDTPGPARRELTDIILHRSLEEVAHVLPVQAVHGHADLIVQPLQPELCKTRACCVTAHPPPPRQLRAGATPQGISTQRFRLPHKTWPSSQKLNS